MNEKKVRENWWINHEDPPIEGAHPFWSEEHKPDYATIGKAIGELVARKNKAYGNSFAQSGDVLRVLYPEGVAPYQYDTLLYITRVLDKLFRIVADNDPEGENPAMDIAGYSILEVGRKKYKDGR